MPHACTWYSLARIPNQSPDAVSVLQGHHRPLQQALAVWTCASASPINAAGGVLMSRLHGEVSGRATSACGTPARLSQSALAFFRALCSWMCC
eukprot:8797391-Alexandrium_andersonii.AAC.1